LRSKNRRWVEFIFNVKFEPTTKESGDGITAGRRERIEQFHLMAIGTGSKTLCPC